MAEKQKVSEKVTVQTEALQAMVDYVSRQPFVEVSGLIDNLIRSVEQVQEQVTSKDDSPKKIKP